MQIECHTVMLGFSDPARSHLTLLSAEYAQLLPASCRDALRSPEARLLHRLPRPTPDGRSMLVLRDGVKRRTTATRWADSTTSSAVCRLEVDTRSVRATSFAEHDPPERLIGLDNLEATRRAGRGELVKLGALRPGHFSPIVHLMVNYSGTGLDSVFLALADSTRRGMIDRLSQGPATVGELGEPFPVTKPAITKHVRTLEEAGLIRRERVGRFHRCTLVPEALRRAEVWIERHRKFWESSLDRLTRHVETTSATSPHTGGRK